MEDKTDITIVNGSSFENDEKVGSIAVEKTGTFISGYSVITKSMIGAGMFAMAAGCLNFGLIMGCLFLMLAGAITWLSLKVLSVLALDFAGTTPTFYSVSESIMPRAKWVVDAALVINCWGGNIAYIQMAGSWMTSGLYGFIQWDTASFSLDTFKIVIQLAILGLLAPLCMMKTISGTKIANLVGMACIAFILVMTFFFTPCSRASSDLLAPGNALRAFGSFPTFIFAYACQQNAFTVANELKDASQKKLDRISFASVATGFLIYLPVMILPLLTFGGSIKDNYLDNLAIEYPESVVLRIGFILASLSVSISYVLLMLPVRNSLMSLIFGSNQPTGKKEVTYRVSITAIMMGGSFLLAWALASNSSLPINLAGLLGGNTMCFVMPFMLYLTKYGFNKNNKFSIFVLATLGFCILLYPICLTGIIYDAVNKSS
jgi:amino acid permease